MAGDATNIYHGPLASVSIDDAGGSAPNDMGYLGNNNASISFEPQGYELGDGQNAQLFGMGKVEIEIAETDSTHLGYIDTTAEQKLILTALDATTYTIDNVLVTYEVKRGFGNDPHVLIIRAQKKAIDEDDFVTIA